MNSCFATQRICRRFGFMLFNLIIATGTIGALFGAAMRTYHNQLGPQPSMAGS